ncbi:hypothetical protein RFI_16439 [Reticulomyxa filosa]|uniref:t-SNARE coiled-coil homology domain-containing protein n=1 Tax=Reticulomyxa filosa TaxID=46433 RepID=X6N639_RETFI|nr:hypothetical protein RFI_16439 [Reticulomyxa filosa]|eukprot:ETO20777.1 hypothetical protein RFI_16439 [Reticulomyxa filosa]
MESNIQPLLQDTNPASLLEKNLCQLWKYQRNISEYSETIGKAADTLERRKEIKKEIQTAIRLSAQINQNINDFESKSSDAAASQKWRRDYAKQVRSLKSVVEQIITKQERYSVASQNPILEPVDARKVEKPTPVALQKGQQQQQQVDEFRLIESYRLDELEQREERVYEVVQELLDLKNMVTDLHDTVQRQEEHVVMLKNNVDDVNDNMKPALDNIITAKTRQRAYRNRLCWMLLIVLCLLGVIVSVIFLTKKN